MDLEKKSTYSYAMNKMGAGGTSGTERTVSYMSAIFDIAEKEFASL